MQGRDESAWNIVRISAKQHVGDEDIHSRKLVLIFPNFLIGESMRSFLPAKSTYIR
jgi:hypothetical protein